MFSALVKLDDDAVLFPKPWFDALDQPLLDIDGKLMQPANQFPPLRQQLRSSEPRWLGNFRAQDKVRRNGKWGISTAVYPHQFWPAYASGPAHICNRAFVHWMGKNAASLRTSRANGDGFSQHEGHVWMEDVAHAFWFEQAAMHFQQTYPDGSKAACRLFDHRFPSFPNECAYDSISMGSLWHSPAIKIMLRVCASIEAYAYNILCVADGQLH